MRKKFLVFLSSTILVLSLSHYASAAPIIDQVNPMGNTCFNMDYTGFNWQQEIVVGAGGLLSSLDLYVVTLGSVDLYINKGSGWQTDTNDYYNAGLSLTASGWNSIDLTGAGLSFNVGDTFIIGLLGIDDNLHLNGSGLTDIYTAGALYMNGAVYSNGTYDISFKTYMDSDSSPVPEPATMLLFSIGILGIAGASRKKLI